MTGTSLIPGLVVASGLFDLVCTVTAYRNGWLVELNPLAAAVLESSGEAGLALYRVAATAAGLVVLRAGLRACRLRSRLDPASRALSPVAFTALAAIVATHIGLAAWWAAWLSV